MPNPDQWAQLEEAIDEYEEELEQGQTLLDKTGVVNPIGQAYKLAQVVIVLAKELITTHNEELENGAPPFITG